MSTQLLSRLRRPVKSLLMAAGVDFRMKTEDRRILEGTILPAIAAIAGISNEFFSLGAIGTRGATNGCLPHAITGRWKLIRPRANTAPGSISSILPKIWRSTFKPDSLDFIVCNGVIGWGLDDRAGIEKMLESCWICLREKGVLMIGWNDVPEHSPVPLSDLDALKKFQPYVFPELGKSELLTDSDLRHTYNFYVK